MAERTAVRLMNLYERGRITRMELILRAFDWVDPADPTPVLEGLLADVLDEMLIMAPGFLADRIRIHPGSPPTREQAAAVKAWIESRRVQRA